MSIKSVRLQYSDLALGGSSHKEYRLFLEKKDGGYVVNYENGRIGDTLHPGTRTVTPLPLEEAEQKYNSILAGKLKDGYSLVKNGTVAEAPSSPLPVAPMTNRTPFPVSKLAEINEEDAGTYVKSLGYYMQPKIDGQRRQLRYANGVYTGYNKLGNPVPVSQALAADLALLKLQSFFLDGEIVGDDYIAFDIFMANGKEVSGAPYSQRLELLELLPKRKARSHFIVIPTWKTVVAKREALKCLKEERAEGAAFKNTNMPYHAGVSTQDFKLKFLKSCTCEVIRIGDKGHDSATLAVLDDGKLREVGRASMIGKDKGIQVGSLVEVVFLNFTGSRLYQPRIVALRDDQSEADSIAKVMAGLKQGVSV
jgi:bifunctional non-homologous end joining protein LigD